MCCSKLNCTLLRKIICFYLTFPEIPAPSTTSTSTVLPVTPPMTARKKGKCHLVIAFTDTHKYSMCALHTGGEQYIAFSGVCRKIVKGDY